MPGLQKALDALRAKVRKGPNPDTVDTPCAERTLRWQVGLMLPVRPETAAKPGAKWNHARTLGLGNSTLAVVDVNVNHELERLSPDKATIELGGVPSIAPGRTKMVDASLEGQIVVDLTDGLADSGWVALDTKLRPEGAARLLARDVDCDWVVKRIRE